MTSLSFGERPLTSCHETGFSLKWAVHITQTMTGLITCTFHRLFRKCNISMYCLILINPFLYLISCLRLLRGYLKLLYPNFFGSRQTGLLVFPRFDTSHQLNPNLDSEWAVHHYLSIAPASLFLPLLAITSAHATYVLGPTLIR